MVIIRRFFHDEWFKISNNLKKQMEEDFFIQPFHTEKALVHFKNKKSMKLLCKNKGCTIVGKYFFKFKKWSFAQHATTKMIPSYSGWTSFGGIPLDSWNMNTFYQIGEACGGFLKVSSKTKEGKDLVESKIKIKYKYLGFILANIRITNGTGNSFIVQTVAHADEKWLSKRNVQRHDTFKRQAAANFNEYNLEAEQYNFGKNEALPSYIHKSKKNKSINEDLIPLFNSINVKRSISFDRDKRKHRANNRQNDELGKGKSLMHNNDEKIEIEKESTPQSKQ